MCDLIATDNAIKILVEQSKQEFGSYDSYGSQDDELEVERKVENEIEMDQISELSEIKEVEIEVIEQKQSE